MLISIIILVYCFILLNLLASPTFVQYCFVMMNFFVFGQSINFVSTTNLFAVYLLASPYRWFSKERYPYPVCLPLIIVIVRSFTFLVIYVIKRFRYIVTTIFALCYQYCANYVRFWKLTIHFLVNYFKILIPELNFLNYKLFMFHYINYVILMIVFLIVIVLVKGHLLNVFLIIKTFFSTW